MSNLAVYPVLLPAITAVVLLLLHGRLQAQRVLTMVSMIMGLALSVYLTREVYNGDLLVSQLGGWAAPYGITLVIDLLAGMMIVLAFISGITTTLFGYKDMDPLRERSFYYPMVQFLLVGINLSSVTGDLFNLFVAFEVMLIASYFLITLGGEKGQLREGFKYLAINAVVSVFFLVGVALIYGVTGSLNMADIAQKAAQLGNDPIMTLAGMILLIVFGTKAAIFPLYFWMPRSYFEAPSTISALFVAMLTKVGVYALVRTFTLIFVQDIGFTHNLLLWIAGFTMVLGVLGAVAQYDFKAILAYHSISQIGYMIMGLGLFSQVALAGTVIYMAHHTFIKSGLFLLSGVTKRITGHTNLKYYSGLLTTHPGLAFTFLASAVSLAGIPPFSGFFSKFALIKAGVELERFGIVAVSLVVSIFTLFSMVKIFRKGFWGEQTGERRSDAEVGLVQVMTPPLILLGISVIMGFGAGYVLEFALATADQLLDPSIYIRAVLGR